MKESTTVNLTRTKLENFINELKPIFIKFWLEHEHFDRAFRVSAVFQLMMQQIIIDEELKDFTSKGKRVWNPLSTKQKDCIREMRKCWITLKRIWECFNITGERIRQITSEPVSE